MKNLLLFLLVATAGFTASAQDLVANQNPDYKLSLAKYTAGRDDLQRTLNTTVQNTYKAYDWRTAKNEKRAERISYRRERNLANNFSNCCNNGFNNNGFNNFNPYPNNLFRAPFLPRFNFGRQWCR